MDGTCIPGRRRIAMTDIQVIIIIIDIKGNTVFDIIFGPPLWIPLYQKECINYFWQSSIYMYGCHRHHH